MDRAHGERESADKAEWLVKEAFGVDEDTLLRDFLLAQTEVKDCQIPPEPEDGFTKLLGEIQEREGHAGKEADSKGAADRDVGRRTRLRPLFKAALVAAVAAIMILATVITVGAKKNYRYTVRQRDSVRSDIVLNNIEALPDKDALSAAYDEIDKNTGINVLKLAYIPAKMKYLKTEINNNYAILSFEYKGKIFSVLQQSRKADTSLNIVSDRTPYTTVYNEWLKRDIEIDKAITDDGDVEYSALIVDGDTYYLLAGIIEEQEFKKVVRDVYVEN